MPTKWEKVEKVKTPELNRLAEVSVTSTTIGEFIDWLHNDQKLRLCEWREEVRRGHDRDYAPEGFYEDSRSIEQLLADYFKIDLKKIEAERRALLAAMQDDDIPKLPRV